jgi:hypothetical protein
VGAHPNSGFGSSARRPAAHGLRGLPGLPSAGPPHPQGTKEEGAEEHDNADKQQEQQAFRDDTHDAKRDRHDYQ